MPFFANGSLFERLGLQGLARRLRLGFSELSHALTGRNRLARATQAQFVQWLADPGFDLGHLGLHREDVPVLVEMNGDLLWLPGDLLKFIWHTRVLSTAAWTPRFLAETEHYCYVRKRLLPGQTVLDCGANIGLFTTMMAGCVGDSGAVFAFEPSPVAAADLRRVLVLNQRANVQVVTSAISDKVGSVTFVEVDTPDVRREGSQLLALDGRSDGVPNREIQVSTTTLDIFCSEHHIKPDLIKIDIEGAELMALDGGQSVIDSYRPVLVIESHPGRAGHFDHERLLKYLSAYGYRYRWKGKTYYCEARR